MEQGTCGQTLECTSLSLSVIVSLPPHIPLAISIVADDWVHKKSIQKRTLKWRRLRKQTPEHTDRVTCLPTPVTLSARAMVSVAGLRLELVYAKDIWPKAI